MTITGKDLEIHYDEEWAALYVKGKLDEVGDAYVAEERAFALLGVTVVSDDAFMRGQNKQDGVAKTLAEVEAYRSSREASTAKAEELRALAAALRAEADAIEQTVGTG